MNPFHFAVSARLRRPASGYRPLFVALLAVLMSACAGPEEPAALDDSAMDHGAMEHGVAEPSSDPAVVDGDAEARPFAPQVFGANTGDYGVSLTPDGSTIFFTRAMPSAVGEAIFLTRRSGAGWSEPEMAPFSGRYHDKEPYVSPDGGRVYFASKRPVRGFGARQDFDIWYVERRGDGWGEPAHVAAVASGENDDYPAVAADGTLVLARSDESGNVDLWIAYAGTGGLTAPRPFGRPINTVYAEADPWIAPDGSFIVFSSPRIGENAEGQGDLYVIHRQGEAWTAPASLGPTVNSIAHEYGPALSPDGATLYFSRGFGGQVWAASRAALQGLGADAGQ